ncbi:kinase-like domain-containing protein [Lyophyllum atratum]|nr:kinase-like domain-containing protein [Lyophyllum atratum]
MSSSFLDQYDLLDVIGNGSFGIIRKVRRKSDGLIFARKELNFERMNDRDRKQIVAEVNILKDLAHDHIVRYHDRYVDRDAGILYIMMEYCGGGDLSTVIKQSARTNRPISEDKIWSYFLQILLALNHCHHPNGHARNSSGGGTGIGGFENAGSANRAQILHRDLKPDNVFLDTADKVKLGDFGLSRALTQTTFANTYVGTPYYMSPELMQEKAYDTKSDIWSLGCVIYELCALKPPFHEAKTHQELSNCIRNGRIPPLPRGYSQGLASIIKSMLNLNPAMRPSAAQLLQHERLTLTSKVLEAEKILASVKSHRVDAAAKERDLNVRESLLREREQHMMAAAGQKDAEIANLHHMVAALQQEQAQQQHDYYTQPQVEEAIKDAVGRREEELRVLVMKREKEVADAMARREEEIMEAVRRREAEVCEAWTARELEIRREIEEKVKELDERVDWIQAKEEELKAEEVRLDTARVELEEKMEKWEESVAKGRKEKTPLEEVKNILAPLARLAEDTPLQQRRKLDIPTPKPPLKAPFPSLSTPVTRPAKYDAMPSAMKGVVLTTTGEVLATPTPAELANLFTNSPKVGLNFTKIFDFDDGEEEEEHATPKSAPAEQEPSPPPSPSSRKEKEKNKSKGREREPSSDAGSSSSSSTGATTSNTSNAPPTRLRRPSIRSRPPVKRATTLPPTSTSDPTGLSSASASSSTSQLVAKPLPHPHLNNTATRVTMPITNSHPPKYDLADEENLPSPFIKRSLERAATTRASSMNAKPAKKRPSSGQTLRAVAVVNAAGKRVSASLSSDDVLSESPGALNARPALTSARKASEEARKALSRS